MDVNDPATLDRFMAKVDRRPGGCWLWAASTNRQGYGFFWDADEKRMVTAHRASYLLHGGVLPERPAGTRGPGPVVLRHTCDQPRCVNPAHLEPGTQGDNVRDCVERGRFACRAGVANGRAKLTAEDIEQIRALDLSRHGAKSAAARRYGISSGQMSKILLGHSWT